ncbi:MAG: DUF1638 domain-containing protein [Candidatus Korobacteraceae bacterium]
MRLLLIGCGLLLRELSDAIVRSPHLIEARFLPAGLHDSGAKLMRQRLQQEIDAADTSNYDAIVLGYALCGMGMAGLKAPAVPLVVPRAHDCITLLMGSREKYVEYFHANPGVYFRSVGWMERSREIHDQLFAGGLSQDRDALIAKYGEEAGQYLYEEATRYRKSYRKLTYIRTASEFDDHFAELAQAEAREKNWSYEEFAGSLTLFRRLLAGDWQSDFLIVPPGQVIQATQTDGIIDSASPPACNLIGK